VTFCNPGNCWMAHRPIRYPDWAGIYMHLEISITLSCNVHNEQVKSNSMAVADLQPSFKKGQRKGWDLEEAPEVRDIGTAEFGLPVAQHTAKPRAL
jgi:hypothetical protein